MAAGGIARRGLRALGLHVQRYPGADNLRGATKRVLEARQVDAVLDVGANVGQYAAGLRDAGYGGTIVSIEPVAEAFAQLEARSAGDRRWHVHRLALGSEPGRLELNVTASSSVSSFLTPRDDYVDRYDGARTVRREPVEVARLDAVLDDLAPGARRILLKCDTQGFDLEVVRGADGVADRLVALQCELSVHPIYEGAVDYLDALGQLRTLGWAPVAFFPVVSDPELRALELDGLFVRA